MAKKRTGKPETTIDTVYCSVDGWRRRFTFGVNPRRGGKHGDLFGNEPYDEYDTVVVHGTVRHHHTDRKDRRRSFKAVQVYVYPSHVPRDKWRDDPESVGGAWTEKDVLHAGVILPADAYYSLVPCFAAGHYREIRVEVKDLRYTRGKSYRVTFDPEETPPEDM